MKKTIITMLIALVAICASAETYNYLKFTKTNGSTVTCSVAGIKVTYDNNNVTVTNDEGTTTIALAEVQDMYFSNEAGSAVTLGDVNGDGLVNITDVTLLINYVLNDGTVEIVEEAANMNGDEGINITDVTLLINEVMNSTN